MAPIRDTEPEPKVIVLSGSAFTMAGMERTMQTLGRGLAAFGFSSDVIIPNGHISRDIQQWFLDHATSATASDQLTNVMKHGLREIYPLVKFLRSRNGNLVNIHSPGHHVPIVEVLAARLAGLPAITSIHGYDSRTTTSGLERWRNVIFGAPLNAKVVTPTEIVKRQQERKGISPDKLELIYCGVAVPECPMSREEARRHLNLADEAFVIVTFGRLVPDKGIDVLIEAVNAMPDELLGRLVVLIGGTGDQQSLERLVDDRTRDKIRFLGHVTDTSPYYAAADIFVLPSRHEPFGLVFLEAAHHGVPSIGTRVGGIPEAISDGETGLLVSPEKPHALKETIAALSRDSRLQRQMGRAAQRRARALFRDETMVRAYADLFRNVLGAADAQRRSQLRQPTSSSELTE